MKLAEYFKDYKEIVAKHQQIKESHKRFYIIGVELFLNYLEENNIAEKKLSESEKLTNFIKYLHENNKHKDWQINQSIDAINLLYTLVKDKVNNDLTTLDYIIEQIQNIIKLKHYSNKTEKNYIYWNKYFYHYIQKKYFKL